MKFTCLRCGNCCRGWSVPLWHTDIDHLLKVLSPEQLARNTCWSDLGVLQILKINEDCPFLRDDRCSIYTHRPIACRAFPANQSADALRRCKGEGNYTRAMLKAARDEVVNRNALYLMGRDAYYTRFVELMKGVTLAPQELKEWHRRFEAM